MQNAVTNILWTVAGLCAIATIYPYLLYPLLLRVLPARTGDTTSLRSEDGREFALLFCAHNEAKALPDKIRNLRELRTTFPELEILSYDDCSSDGTPDMLETAGLEIQVARGAERAGKARGMKTLATMTEREFLVFTDANVELSPEALHQLCAAYADPSIGGICGLLQYVDNAGSPVANVGGLYWRIEELIKSLESRSGNVMGADGSIFSIRRSLYPDFPDTVLDDLTVSMGVIFQRYRLIKDPRVTAQERLVASRHDDYRRRVRIATRAFHTHMWLRPKIRAMPIGDRWRYWSHRYLRWHGAFFVTLGFLSGLMALGLSTHWVATVTAVAVTAGIAVAGTYLKLGVLSGLVHMMSSILLTGFGVTRARQGQTMTTWKPPTR